MYVALYIRVSTEDQAEKWSLAAQERILTELAKARGWEYEVFRDVGSGTSIQQRPALQELLSSLPQFDAIAVVDLDRLARPTDLMEYALLKAALKRAGAKVITPTQEFSFTDEQDDFLADLLTLLARWERQMILKRVQRGRLEKLRKGERWGTFQHLYGYRYENGKYEIMEEEAELVREIFRLARWKGGHTIAKILNERGIPSPWGKKWHNSQIRRILFNPIYAGKPAVGRGRPFGAKSPNYPNPFGERGMDDWIWVEKEVPPIISFEEWMEVCQAVARRRAGRGSRYIYLFTGILKCPQCGKGMAGNGLAHAGWGYYSCECRRKKDGYRRFIPAPKVEWIAERVFEKVKSSADVLEAVRKEWEKIHQGIASPSEERLERRLTTLEEGRKKLLDLYLEGHIGKEEWRAKDEELRKKQEQIRHQLEVVQSGKKVQRVLNIVESIRELRWEDLKREEQKEFCHLVFKKITITPEGEIQTVELWEPFHLLGI